MFADIANEFQNTTKFDLLQYFIDYRDFMQDDYSSVYNYFSGVSETIDVNRLKRLSNLISRSNDLTRTFQTFAGKLGNVGFWELQQYCQDLKDTLERINKFPKYLCTAKTSRGYKPYIQVASDIGGMKTIEDLATQLGSTTEQDLILNNDLEEEQWDIDKLSQVTALVNNNTDVVVTTIMEQPIGRNIYGRDIKKKITLVDNDVETVEFEDNVEQKVTILLELNQGDVPELPNFGKKVTNGQSYSAYNYAELITDVRDNFLQNDLFESVNITDLDYKDGQIYAECSVKTKYTYSTTKSVKI